jgi:hypothetical protein
MSRCWRDAIQTYSGKEFFPLEPKIEDICIEDIAHALSIMARFGGHSVKHYSIGQHCIMVSNYCNPKDARWGMAHDFTEAYLSDVCSPVKRHEDFRFYRIAEARLMAAICERFDLPEEQPDSVTKADQLVLAAEVRDLMSKPLLGKPHWKCMDLDVSFIPKITPLLPENAEVAFMNRYHELFD